MQEEYISFYKVKQLLDMAVLVKIRRFFGCLKHC